VALTKVTGQVVSNTTDVTDGVLTVSGISTFTGRVAIGTDLRVEGSVSVGGTITYEDVTNVNSVGNITVGSGITLSKDGDGFFTGVVTATSYAGDGSGLTGIAATDNVRTGILDVAGVGTFRNDVNIPDKIIHLGDTDTAIRFPSADTITAETGGTERLRITSDGKYQFPGTGGGSGARGLEIDTESIGAADEGVILNARASGNTGQIKLQTNSATAMTVEGNGGNVNVASNLKVTGVCTATSFSGSGAALTNLPTFTEYSTQTVSGTDSYSITITGDPKVIEVSLYEVRHVSGQNIMYRLSNSSSETTSGYYDIGSAWRHDHASNSTARGLNQGQGCLVNYNFNGVNNLITGKAVFTRVNTGLYTFTGCYDHYFHANEGSTTQYNLLSNGHVNNTSAVTQIRIFTSSGGNFTSGTINVRGIA